MRRCLPVVMLLLLGAAFSTQAGDEARTPPPQGPQTLKAEPTTGELSVFAERYVGKEITLFGSYKGFGVNIAERRGESVYTCKGRFDTSSEPAVCSFDRDDVTFSPAAAKADRSKSVVRITGTVKSVFLQQISLTKVRIALANEPADPSPALVVKGVAAGGETSGVWTTDWPAFVRQLSATVARDASFVANVNEAFRGKTVTWEGVVAEIKRPAKPGESGLVRVAMKPEKLAMTGAPTLDRLDLTPGDDEWETWKSVSVGDTVAFVTTLDEGSFLPKCVLTYLVGAGPNAGKTAAWINTKGARRVKK